MKKYSTGEQGSVNVIGENHKVIMQDMQFNLADLATLANNYSNIYTNPKRSVLIEYVTNAWEATKKAKSDKKIRVFAKDTDQGYVFGIQDWGTGLDEEGIKIFGTYAKSTKEEHEIGGHGIGCKSAFAITNQFFVNTVKDGQKIKAIFTREPGKVPNMVIMPAVPTEESNGTTVFMHLDRYVIETILNHYSDIRYFDNVTFDVDSIFNFDPKPVNIYHFKSFSVDYIDGSISQGTLFLIGKVLYHIPGEIVRACKYAHFSNNPLPIKIHLDPSLIRTLPNREGIDFSGNIGKQTTKEYLVDLINNAITEYLELIENCIPDECSFEEWVSGVWEKIDTVYYSEYDIQLPTSARLPNNHVLPKEGKRILNYIQNRDFKDYAFKNLKRLFEGNIQSLLKGLIGSDLLFENYVRVAPYTRSLNNGSIHFSIYLDYLNGHTVFYKTDKTVSSKKKESYLFEQVYGRDKSLVVIKIPDTLELIRDSNKSLPDKILAKMLIEFRDRIASDFKDFDTVKVPKVKKVKTISGSATRVKSVNEGWYLQKHRLSYNDSTSIVVESADYYKESELRSKTILDATEYSDEEICAILHLSKRFVFYSSVINSVRVINTVKIFRNYMEKKALYSSIKLDRDINIAEINEILSSMNYRDKEGFTTMGGEFLRTLNEVQKYVKKYQNNKPSIGLSSRQKEYWKTIVGESRAIDYESRYYLAKAKKLELFLKNFPLDNMTSSYGSNSVKMSFLAKLLAYHLRMKPGVKFINETKLVTND